MSRRGRLDGKEEGDTVKGIRIGLRCCRQTPGSLYSSIFRPRFAACLQLHSAHLLTLSSVVLHVSVESLEPLELNSRANHASTPLA